MQLNGFCIVVTQRIQIVEILLVNVFGHVNTVEHGAFKLLNFRVLGTHRVDEIVQILENQAVGTDDLDPLLDRLRSGDIPSQADVFGQSLTGFLREFGISDPDGELAGRDLDKGLKAFQRRLVRDDGISLDQAVERAVWGMLPKNKLSRQQMSKLKVYSGPDHPHAAQQPQPYEITQIAQ